MSPVSVVGAIVDERLHLTVRHQRHVVGGWFAERMAGHLQSVLEQMAADPDRAIGQLDIPDSSEAATIAALGRGRERPTGVTTVIDGVSSRIALHPEREAIRGRDRSMTYRELGLGIDRLAARLAALGVGRGDTVGLHLDRTVDLPVAILAILRCGAAYVPVDTRMPLDRIRRMLLDADVAAVVTDGDEGATVLVDHGRPAVRVVDDAADGPAGSDLPGPFGPSDPDDVVYIMYTSGSTGEPKGVRLGNATLVNLLDSLADRPGFGADDRILALATVAFDISFVELILPLWTGGSAVVVDADTAVDGDALRQLIDETAPTVVQATPTTWQLLRAAGWDGCPGLSVWSTGAALERELADWLLDRGREVWNLFGPTETHVCTVADVRPGTGPVPIGHPIDNTVIEVVGPDLVARPLGLRGELLVGGSAVADGYHGRPDLTADRFIERAGRRFHRTGDQVSLEPDGRLHYHGRRDDQVKIRGHRVELGEVESAAAAHPSVLAAAATTHEIGVGDERLALHVVPEPGAVIDPTDVHRFLAERLPSFMLPAAVVAIDALPQLANRKVDRSALPAPERWIQTGAEAAPPRTATERLLARVWCEVLGLVEVGINESFFDLGGHSLLATQIASRVRQQAGVALPLAALYQYPTVAELAPLVDGAERVAVEVIERVDRSEPLPLTYSQERIWFLQQLQPDGAAYNMPGAARIRGSFDVEILRAAFADLVERHEVLRTRFVPRDGRPLQVIEASSRYGVDVVDHRSAAADPETVRSEVADLLHVEAARPFRLDQAPLFRVVVHRLADDDQVLFLNMHHVLGDEWSFGILFSELIRRYLARQRQATGQPPDPALELPELPIQCADYAVWQRERLASGALDDQLAYWRTHLADLPVIELPADRRRPPEQSGRGAHVDVELPDDLAEAVAGLSRRLMTSPFVVMLSAFEALLHRYTGAEDLVVGCPVANRNTIDSELLVTSLVNSLVLRVGVAGDHTFDRLVGEVHRTAMAAFANQDVPFEKLVQDLQPTRDPSRSPLFQVFFNMLNAPYELPRLPGIDLEVEQVDRGAAQFDLTMTVHPRLGSLRIEYSTDLFDRDRIERMADHYLRLLGDAVTRPDSPVAELELVGQDELDALAEVWGHEASEPFDDQSVLHELVADQARSAPERRAVSCGQEVLSYRALDERADHLAARLHSAGIGPGDAVAILVERSVHSAVAMVGINRAGAAFVPLDPELPAERLRFMVDDAAVRCLVVAGGVDDLVERCRVGADRERPLPVIRLGSESPAGPVSPPRVEVAATDLAWIIYTSGSTGRPKGCEIEHRSAVNLFRSMATRPGIGPDDVVLSVTPASFDPSIQDVYLALLNGAEVNVAPHEATIDGSRLVDLIEGSGATQMFSTPATWRLLLDAGWAGRPGFVAQTGGEPMPRDLADAVAARVGSLWNLYGLTETTIWSSATPVEPGVGPVGIGPPVANTGFHILDQRGAPVGVGLPGELCIGGVGLGRGFRNRPELEAERFIEYPTPGQAGGRLYRTGDIADYDTAGRLRIHGRADGQIKLRGRRVDVAEIEQALRDHDRIDAAAVVPTDRAGETQVIAFVVPTGETVPDDDELREHLRHQLPAYMLPVAFFPVEALPLNANGKVDRRALVVPDRDLWPSPPSEPPANELERSLAGLWERHLGRSGIGRHDDYFDLGGNSLQAAALFADIAELTGQEYPLAALFRGPTIAELARLIGDEWRPTFTSLVAVDPRGDETPYFSVSPFLISTLSYRLLSDHLGPGQPLYAIQPRGLESDDPVQDRIEEMAAHYLTELKAVQPSGPYRIGGHCAGNWVAFEMALQLQRGGEEVEHLVLVDWGPPGYEHERPRGLGPALGVLRHYRRTGRLIPALSWQLALVTQRFRARWYNTTTDRRIAAVRRAHARAHGAYRPSGRFAGDALLLRSRESVERWDCDWHLHWADLIDGDLEVQEVPGTHASLMLEAEHTRVLATHLSRRFSSSSVPATPGGGTLGPGRRAGDLVG